MLRKLALLSLSAVAGLLLSGCWDHKTTYMSLMQHPQHLQRVYNQCVEEIVSPALPCELILRAQSDFTALTNQREQDPERFGAQILQAEENELYFKQKFDATVQAYHLVGDKHPGIEELKSMREEVDKARDVYKLNVEKVKILLSVIAATSSV